MDERPEGTATAAVNAGIGEREIADVELQRILATDARIGKIREVVKAADRAVEQGDLQTGAIYLVIAADLQESPVLRILAELCVQLVNGGA